MNIKYVYLLIIIFFTEANATVISINPNTKEEVTKALTILTDDKINTIGISVIKAGQIEWVAHFGDQSPGIIANSKTLFDVGSLTKTVTTQTILRLVNENKIKLDESMTHYWLDPDLQETAIHTELTPRMALTHSTGFPNWRFFTDDGKLGFINPPGSKYGYSSEGFQYLARFAEKKIKTPFDQLVQKYVFEPSGISNASLRIDKKYYPFIAQALDKEGKFYGHYCRPGWCSEEGSLSAAGGMVISVEEFSQFLIWAMNGAELGDQLNQQINGITVDQEIIKGFDCSKHPEALCPNRQGYGLGWNVTEYPGGRVIGHGGSDWSLVTLTYYYPEQKDGLVIFINAPNDIALSAMIEVLKILDPESPKLHEYQFRLDRENN
jgi:CubicO group peptidase (beta-lactamase class C family)